MPEQPKSSLQCYLPKLPHPHTVLHIPGSHTLFIGPPSCMRRHAIHAQQYGGRRDISFLMISETDVISGSYEQAICSAVDSLLTLREPAPYIIFLAVFCIDDFLGTDENALLSVLRASHPGRQFAIHHIDPVSLSRDVHMGTRKQAALYSFIPACAVHDRGVNLLGCFVPPQETCELHELLRKWGAGPQRTLFACKDYAEYTDMGRSCLNLVFREMADGAAAEMEERLSIPCFRFSNMYDAAHVAESYRAIAALLGAPEPDLHEALAAGSGNGAGPAGTASCSRLQRFDHTLLTCPGPA